MNEETPKIPIRKEGAGPHKLNVFELVKSLLLKENPFAKEVLELIKYKSIQDVQKIFAQRLEKLEELKDFYGKYLNIETGEEDEEGYDLPKEEAEKYLEYEQYFKQIGFNINDHHKIEELEKNLEEVVTWCGASLDLQEVETNPDIKIGLENVLNRKKYLNKLFTELCELEKDGNKLTMLVGNIGQNLLFKQRKSIAEVKNFILKEIMPSYVNSNSDKINTPILLKQYTDVKNLVDEYLQEKE
jgi:hypothetical protein